MAKKKKEVETKKIEIPEEKPSFFPKLLMLVSLLLIVLAVVNIFNLWTTPCLITNALLLVAGLWLLKIGFERGFGKRRKEILKKYI